MRNSIEKKQFNRSNTSNMDPACFTLSNKDMHVGLSHQIMLQTLNAENGVSSVSLSPEQRLAITNIKKIIEEMIIETTHLITHLKQFNDTYDFNGSPDLRERSIKYYNILGDFTYFTQMASIAKEALDGKLDFPSVKQNIGLYLRDVRTRYTTFNEITIELDRFASNLGKDQVTAARGIISEIKKHTVNMGLKISHIDREFNSCR
jgi:hypothetical protein